MTDIDEALDWRGQEVRCEACIHRGLLAEGRFRPAEQKKSEAGLRKRAGGLGR